MNKNINEFITYISKSVSNINETEIENAATTIVDAIDNNGKIYIFGTGHSYLVSEEMFGRANSLPYTIPIFAPELSITQNPIKSTLIERIPEYFNVINGMYNFKSGDVILITSNSGRNGLPIELALKLKARGLKIIAITNIEFSKKIKSRHPSGKLLYQISDINLDTRVGLNDGEHKIKNLRIGSISTLMGIAISQTLNVAIANELLKRNKTIEYFKSSNLNGNDNTNLEIMKKYYGGFWKDE